MLWSTLQQWSTMRDQSRCSGIRPLTLKQNTVTNTSICTETIIQIERWREKKRERENGERKETEFSILWSCQVGQWRMVKCGVFIKIYIYIKLRIDILSFYVSVSPNHVAYSLSPPSKKSRRVSAINDENFRTIFLTVLNELYCQVVIKVLTFGRSYYFVLELL